MKISRNWNWIINWESVMGWILFEFEFDWIWFSVFDFFKSSFRFHTYKCVMFLAPYAPSVDKTHYFLSLLTNFSVRPPFDVNLDIAMHFSSHLRNLRISVTARYHWSPPISVICAPRQWLEQFFAPVLHQHEALNEVNIDIGRFNKVICLPLIRTLMLYW